MSSYNKILVSTTSTLEGITIKKYLQPISSHVVAGTNFFSDLFASFSDVFGGRSQTYQRQLNDIYNEAIETLKKTAFELGANCIIGLKVDLDEISGKNKSMFMITAVGTAVVIENNQGTTNKEETTITDIISIDKMREFLIKEELKIQAKNNTLELTDETWDFITKKCFYEIAEYILEKSLKKYLALPEYGSENDLKKLYQQLLSFLISIPEKIRIQLLYKYYLSNNDKILYQLLVDLNAFDIQEIKNMLQTDDDQLKVKVLPLINIEKTYYDTNDISHFEELIKLIENNFPILVEFSNQKKLFSSKEKEVWICKCGTKNDINLTHCQNCGKDIYGLSNKEIHPPKIIQTLKAKISILQTHLTQIKDNS